MKLLDLVFRSLLEVTNCSPFLSWGEKYEAEVDVDRENFKLEMMWLLREMNVDNNIVGW